MRKTITWILAITLTCAALAFAGVPQTINYQGYLKNTVSGVPANGPVNMIFSLYSSATPRNNPVWREPIKAVDVTNGIYSTTVGSTLNPLTAPFNVPYYLGVKVGADPELAAQPLASVPYAQRAAFVDAVGNNAIGTSSIADGSVTTPKIANGAVTDAKITGPISAGKLDLSGVLASLTTLQATITTQQTAISQLQTASGLQQTTITQQQALIDSLNIQVSQLNIPPTVSAGYDMATSPGTLLLLYGKLSDPDLNQTITFSWSIVSRPAGSVAPLKEANRMVALFTPDLPGTYQISLTASDGIATVMRSTTIAVTSGMLGRTQLIETDDVSGASSPQIAMDSSGNGVAVWQQSDGIRYNIWANRFSPTSGWGTRQLLQTDSTKDTSSPRVAMGGSGSAMAVWQQYDGSRYNIWANRYNSSTGLWGTAQLIETDNAGDASSPQVATDAFGNAMAVWQQSDGSRNNIWANRYNVTTGLWSAAQLIETDNIGTALYPQVAMDSSGNTLAVWQQNDGTRYNILANRYNTNSGLWGTAQLIETDNAGDANNPMVAMDSSGNAVAVWHQYDGARFNILANRLNVASGLWGAAQLIETDNTGDAFNPQVAMDTSGNAVAIWQQYDGTRYNILANRLNGTTGLWGTAQLIETDTGNAQNPQVTMDSSGNAMAIWQQYDGARNNIWSNSYSIASGQWGAAQLIEVESHDAMNPKVALSASGYALAVWEQDDGLRYNIASNLLSVGWRPAQQIETDNGDAAYPQVATDPSGNAVAVWQQHDGSRYNIWANRYTAASGLWGTAQLIETDNAGNAMYPQVTMGTSGNATAVWQQSDGTHNNIWANRYNGSTGLWGTPQLIETDNTGDAMNPQVASDTSGNAEAVWFQFDGTRYNAWANRYTAASGLWGTAQLIETGNGDAYYPQVAMDGSGNAVAVWYQYDGSHYNIWANRYSAASGLWGAAQLIETDNTGSAFSPQVAMDSTGNAMAVWYQYDGTRNNIWANRYTAASGLWGAAQLIETDNAGSAYGPQVAMDASGNALAVWFQFDGSRYNIWVNQYSTFSGWGIAQLLETDNASYAQLPRVAMNASGMATAVWQQSDGARDNIWAKRFTPGVGWGQAIVVDSDSGGAGVPQVAVSASGEPIVVWQQSDGIRNNIWSNWRW